VGGACVRGQVRPVRRRGHARGRYPDRCRDESGDLREGRYGERRSRPAAPAGAGRRPRARRAGHRAAARPTGRAGPRPRPPPPRGARPRR